MVLAGGSQLKHAGFVAGFLAGEFEMGGWYVSGIHCLCGAVAVGVVK